MLRREFLIGLALAATVRPEKPGVRLARAARAQLGVTRGYDPGYARIAFPNGDVPRETGVCADVVVRAGRNGLGLDLQELLHTDIAKNFGAYPARATWGQTKPDTNIDHRRVPNLETFWARTGCQIWVAKGAVAGNEFPAPLLVGDMLSWRLGGRLPHVGVVSSVDLLGAVVVHNIGGGVEENRLFGFRDQKAFGHYRRPSA
ncbi:hypothetical protein SAMN05421771_1169 [Granulicella pectinivorans]|uniref:DUF1287 domain-containing protein n=1 Tax=Granulicella pectinivorans TaxID=474950 RepID=A0A1I6LRK0_9BACT|nr:DUF1287 domain-containing protein [Granulicella pectinivorans]SFS06127.1 hypothetical protein SAMN05421771_1169 [Granulicella pectinivorans]